MLSPWLRRWLFTTNHKDIGILYFVGALWFGFIGALLAVLMRVQLAAPESNFLGPSAYNQAVTMHGLIMILWFLSPLGIAFANYLIPLQIKAKDLALPRLNALSYWVFLFGGILATLGFFMPGGVASGGWTTYTPLSTSEFTPGAGPTLAFAGLIMLVVSITLGSVNILLTVAYLRGPGITWGKVPMFTWFIVFTMVQMLWAFPALLASLLLLMSDRMLGTVYFASTGGGTLLWANLFWFFGHPEVYVVLLPAFGMIAEVLPVFSRRRLAEKNILLLVTGALVVPLSYLVWQHHMFLTGISTTAQAGFSVSTIMISLPFDIIVLGFILTLWKGYIRLKTPMLFAIGGIVVFIVGGITGVFLSSPVLDVVLHGAYFVVAHFHYVMVGAALFGLIGGIYYYLPKMTGRMYSELTGKIHFLLSLVGFNILYFPQFFLFDMPRRISTYDASTGWGNLNFISSLGGFIFAGAQILLVANLVYTVTRGSPAPQNPWGAVTPEWSADSMKPHSPHTPFVALHNGPISGQPSTLPNGGYEHEAQHLSSRPITLGAGLTIALLGVGLLEYTAGLPFLIAGLAVTAWGLIGWSLDDLRGKFLVIEEIGEQWPFNQITKMRLGMWIFLSTEIVLFGSILGGDIYLRVLSPQSWPFPGTVHEVSIGFVNTLVLITSGLTAVLGLQAIKNGDRKRLAIALTATMILGFVFMGIKAFEWFELIYLHEIPFLFTSGIAGSTYYFTTGIHGAHVTAGLVIMIYLIRKTLNGGYTREKHASVENFVLYWAFVDLVWMFIFPFFYLT